jgi:hypothetical protein
MMKHVPGKIKDKYKILGIIGEGRLYCFVHLYLYNFELIQVHMVLYLKLEDEYVFKRKKKRNFDRYI